MINEVCPHCEKSCVSNWRKLFLLPGERAVRPEDAVRALASDPAISTVFGGDS